MKPFTISLLLLATLLCRLVPQARGGEIHDAAKAGDVEKVKALLKAKPELVNSKDDANFKIDPQVCEEWRNASPLHLAVWEGNTETVKLLLANKADVNAKTGSCVLEWPQQQGACPEVDNDTPLHLAVWKGHKEIVEALLENHADVNAKNGLRETSLHWCQNTDIIKILLANKADVNVKNVRDETPLHIAVNHQLKEVIQTLLENKADVHAKDQWGHTPLGCALQIRIDVENADADEKKAQSVKQQERDRVNETITFLRKHGAKE